MWGNRQKHDQHRFVPPCTIMHECAVAHEVMQEWLGQVRGAWQPSPVQGTLTKPRFHACGGDTAAAGAFTQPCRPKQRAAWQTDELAVMPSSRCRLTPLAGLATQTPKAVFFGCLPLQGLTAFHFLSLLRSDLFLSFFTVSWCCYGDTTRTLPFAQCLAKDTHPLEARHSLHPSRT